MARRRSGVPQPGDQVVGERSAISCELAGPFGLYQRGIQFTAPRIANDSSLASRSEQARSDARLHHLAHAMVELIPPRDHRLPVGGRQRFEIEEERRAVQLVENRVHEGDDQLLQLLVGADVALFDLVENASSRSSEYWWQAKRISSLFRK